MLNKEYIEHPKVDSNESIYKNIVMYMNKYIEHPRHDNNIIYRHIERCRNIYIDHNISKVKKQIMGIM